MDDQGPWFVRVADSKVSVGIFVCEESDLAYLVDEACEANGCEYKRLPPGGFIFGGEVVLHELDPEMDDHDEHMAGWLTDAWLDVYRDEGEWKLIGPLPSDNDNT